MPEVPSIEWHMLTQIVQGLFGFFVWEMMLAGISLFKSGFDRATNV